jgi:hypothetical protein
MRAAAPLDRGTELRRGDEVAGSLTSVAFDPAAGAWLALGYLKRGIDAPVTLSAAGVDVEVLA